MTLSRLRSSFISLAVSLLALFLALAMVSLPAPSRSQERKSADPWLDSETLEPAVLAKMLTDKYVSVPAVVFVGFRSLYVGGHVPDASFHGTASTAQGLAELKSWAASLSRSTDLVIYCGCCPFDKCPNIRPAYTALHSMGFTKIRVLMLPKSFAADWADKGYPMQKGM